jgi:hypothetical protein
MHWRRKARIQPGGLLLVDSHGCCHYSRGKYYPGVYLQFPFCRPTTRLDRETIAAIMPSMFRCLFAILALITLPVCANPPETPKEIAQQILAPLLDPVKVATLKGDRPANQRLYKVMYWLEAARSGGGEVSAVIDQAQAAAGLSAVEAAAK